ncbi:MAG: UDP-N-acetylmuramoyl-L-alanine--D-glutamate ligase [Peptoniphilus duerdenii]|uniref:UDP-N-acetylmuramoyl-L-alanine--D-glutamate ligase n=1 Tax=Peptoniphilus duerdenii TaxID=507750 RepID=UPI0025514B23|nr:UDP-N-acetylmuramoyl-L-alanine--D-glutamate ligase [Peptoniphilus duerdenii]MDK8276456.1 UDP-N-acetylmuramoyl-L-alanine--D-glutamate ligase [Peptoniphilus duerdenii]
MKILIIGTGTTGKSVYNYAKKHEIDAFILDERENYDGLEREDIFNGDFSGIDFAVKSPGIKPESKIIKTLEDKNIKIISDIEFASYFYKTKDIVAITGTNGKTTITTLVNEILNKVGKSYAVGNIGVGVMDVIDYDPKFIVCEASSFQLAYIDKFHPHVAVITNITSDHLDWHKTVENYRKAKENIYKNLEEDDYLILGASCDYVKTINAGVKNTYYYSYDDLGRPGLFTNDGEIIFRHFDGTLENIMKVSDVFIKGRHNIENAMAAILSAYSLGVDLEIIVDTIKNFKGVEHRIEFVRTFNGISYYNDSKGTNPDSTDVALKAFEKSVLIIGGYDKGSDFKKLLEDNKDKITSLVVMGATSELIINEATELGIETTRVKDMEEAVSVATTIARENNSVVLLSPACASWDMYPNYEVRGRHFKEIVMGLER